MKASRDIFWFAALAGVLLILLHESMFMGKGLVPAASILKYSPWNQAVRPSNDLLADQYLTFVPTREFVHRQKSFSLWNPYLCCGVPNLGAIQGAFLFPIHLLLSPLDPFTASGPAAFLKLCLAGWFMMLYLRLLGASQAGAFLGGMVFSLSGFMIVWLGHPHVNCAMWLPLLLYFMEKSFRDPSDGAGGQNAVRAWVGFAVTFAFMILGGHPPTAIHITIVVMVYFVFRLAGQPGRKACQQLGWLAAAVVVGLLLAAPQILPFLEYYRHSSSALSSAATERWSVRLPFASLIHFLLPNCLGNPVKAFEDLPDLLGWPAEANFNERTGYVGILPLFLAACALARPRCKFTKFFFLLALGSMVVIGGLPPISQLIHGLPILRDMNQPRLLLVVGFSVAVLAGLGWDGIFSDARSHRVILILAFGFCALVGAALVGFWIVAGPNYHNLDSAHRVFLGHQMLILGGGMAVVLLLTVWRAGRLNWIPMAICLTWTAADLLCFGIGYNPAIPRADYYPRTPAIEWLQRYHSPFRIFGGGKVLPPDSAEVFGLSDARGCDFMTVRRYEELITGKAGLFSFYTSPTGFPKTFPLLNAKYALAPRIAPLNPALFELVYSNEICIYRYKQCVDRALLVLNSQVETNPAAALARVSSAEFDPRQVLMLEDQPPPPSISANSTGEEQSARIVSYEPDDVMIDATSPRPGYLLLLDTYFPGWTATVNGEPVPILRADYNFRAVTVPAGKSTVRFSYHPQSLRIGLYLCGLGVAVLLAAWIKAVRPR